MMIFSQFLWYSENTKFYIGFVMQGMVLLMMIINISIMMRKSSRNLYLKTCKKKKPRTLNLSEELKEKLRKKLIRMP